MTELWVQTSTDAGLLNFEIVDLGHQFWWQLLLHPILVNEKPIVLDDLFDDLLPLLVIHGLVPLRLAFILGDGDEVLSGWEVVKIQLQLFLELLG